MIKEITMYTVVCDNCKSNSNENEEYSCWYDEDYALDCAIESGWHCEDNTHYCPNCFELDENDEVIRINIMK